MAVQGDSLRRGTVEFIGAFAITFFPAGALMVGSAGLLGIALAYGLALAVMVSVFGHISGGHFNPAVTLALLAVRKIEAGLAAVYWLAQLAGACVAALLLWWIFPADAISPARLGAPTLHPSIGQGAGVVLEAIMTGFLVLAMIVTAADERGAVRAVSGFATGLIVAVAVLAGGPLTGAALNPARAFGPEVVYRVWESYTWIYYVGPLAGAVFATMLYEWLAAGGSRKPLAPPSAGPGTASSS